MRRDLIRPLVYFNYGESRRIPHLRFDCEESRRPEKKRRISTGS
ncbi:DUF935 domain-containing protein [Paenibacillus melissococcoides]|nr:DUF935 domain-containing protein [Paenibacillus melissococcoides]